MKNIANVYIVTQLIIKDKKKVVGGGGGGGIAMCSVPLSTQFFVFKYIYF